MCNLNGKTVLITGASRGIGREFAIGLAKCGADLAINYFNMDKNAEETKNTINSLGRKCTFIKTDLRDEDCAEKIFEKVKGVDILVLNASIQYRKSWDKITVSEFNEQINCNLRASMLLIQKYAPHMKQKKWGRIITVGSVQEIKPHPDMLVYSASKAAQTLMAKSLALQLAGFGVTVNNIAPGVILTDRNTEALSDEEYYKKAISKIPVGYCGQTSDCLGILKLLCSDEGKYITGQNIFVDGGMGMQ